MRNVSMANNRMKELVEQLNKACKAYYVDATELMTNYEFDALYDELLDLEKELGVVLPNSPTINVGYDLQEHLDEDREQGAVVYDDADARTSTKLTKVKHPSKMLSLNKTKDVGELIAWLGDQEGLLSWKLDGLTIVLTYDEGVLKQAVTRGNGTVGEDITPNAHAFQNIPTKISYKNRLVVRGEAVIKYSDFKKINAAIDDADAKYKNPRNLCSGSVRQLDSKITAERNVFFYAFSLNEIDEHDEDSLFKGKRSARMEWLAENGFDVVDYVHVKADNIEAEISKYAEAIKDFDIPSDGLVLTLEDNNYAKTLGATAKFPRDSIAFKWRDQQAETTLREIEWSPSRTGLLNPVAIFDPVELEGTTVSRASVHNVNIVEDLELGIGDIITVYKANMIIPQVAGNKTRSGRFEIPPLCPVCHGATKIRDDAGTRTLICTNPDCIAKHVKSFSHFVSRDAINIEGLSEQSLLKFIGMGILKNLSDIFDLDEHKDEIVNMEGFGELSYSNLIKSINIARHTTPSRLLFSLGINGVGVATANVIGRACNNSWAKIESLDEESLLAINGVGEVLAQDYLEFFHNESNKALIAALIDRVELDESFDEQGSGLSGMIFVITGSLNHYENRKDLKAEIEKEGGKVAGSVSSKTTYLITNDKSSGSSKNEKARELGVSIIDEDEIIQMLSDTK